MFKIKKVLTRMVVISCVFAMISSCAVAIIFAGNARKVYQNNYSYSNVTGTTLSKTGDLFGNSILADGYDYFENTNKDTSSENKVVSSSTKLAPGLNNGEGFILELVIDNNEVDIEVLFSFVTSFVNNWYIGYEPVKFTIKKEITIEGYTSTNYYDGNTWQLSSTCITASQIKPLNEKLVFSEGQNNTIVRFIICWGWEFYVDSVLYQCHSPYLNDSNSYVLNQVIDENEFDNLKDDFKENWTKTNCDFLDTQYSDAGNATITLETSFCVEQLV